MFLNVNEKKVAHSRIGPRAALQRRLNLVEGCIQFGLRAVSAGWQESLLARRLAKGDETTRKRIPGRPSLLGGVTLARRRWPTQPVNVNRADTHGALFQGWSWQHSASPCQQLGTLLADVSALQNLLQGPSRFLRTPLRAKCTSNSYNSA